MNNIIKKIYHNRNTSTASLIIRLLIGVLFVSAGWMKFSNMDMTVGFFTQGGFDAFEAYLVTYTEIIAGTLLILGLIIKPSSVALAVVMTVVVWSTPARPYEIFFGHNYEFIVLVVLIALYFNGAGKYSISNLISRRKSQTTPQA